MQAGGEMRSAASLNNNLPAITPSGTGPGRYEHFLLAQFHRPGYREALSIRPAVRDRRPEANTLIVYVGGRPLNWRIR